MYNKNYLVRPSVTMMKKQNGNICVIVSWWNIFKVNELKFDALKNKYEKADTTMHVILYDNKFLASSCLFERGSGPHSLSAGARKSLRLFAMR